MKITNLMIDLVRSTRHPFRGDHRSDKVHQSRYERRKVRECLRAGDWVLDA